MSDAELLFLFLFCIYLCECAFWVRTGMLVFSSQLGERQRRVNLRWALLRNPDGGILMGNLLPFGQASICQQWPLSLSPQGVYGYVSQALSTDGRPRQPERFIRYRDIRNVEVRGHEVWINGVLFAWTATPGFARRLAGIIKQLQEMAEDKRGELIALALGRHFDFRAIEERLDLFRRLSADLQLACLVLLFLVFILPPILLWLDSPLPFLTLAGCYLGVVFLAGLQFRRAHRILYPEERLDRLKNLLMVLLSPADSIHARDKLAHHLLGNFSPLAVARVVCHRASFEELAGFVWRDLEYPMLPVCPVPDSGPQQTEAWFRICLRGQVEKFLKDAGLDPSSFILPPVPEDGSARTYCPRCLGQYVLEAGTCSDCGGRALVGW